MTIEIQAMTRMKVLVTQNSKINIDKSFFENNVVAKNSWNFWSF